jgi:hypothetical protein
VQEIGTGRADLPVGAGDFALGLIPVRRSLLAAGEPALVTGKVAFPPGQLAGVRDLLPVRGDGEVLDAEVHADDGTCGRELFSQSVSSLPFMAVR